MDEYVNKTTELMKRKKSILLLSSLAYVQVTPQTNIWFNLLHTTI
jgi:hypothetical protein